MSAKAKKIDSKINLGSNLTIDRLKELHQSFLAMSNSKTDIEFETEMIETIDLAGIQFLVHSKEVAREKGFQAIFNFKLSDSAQDLVAKTGFEYLLKH